MTGEYLNQILPEPTFKIGARPLLDIVFVHGLGGDLYGTWQHDKETFWPKWLAQDFTDCRIFVAGYETSALAGVRSGPGASIQDLAMSLLDQLASMQHPCTNMLIVTHSLGGLIVKQMLRRCSDSVNEDFIAVGRSVKGIIFLGTPHVGSQLASAIDYILRNFRSRQAQQLAYAEDGLLELNEFFRNHASRTDLKVKVYYETEYTWGLHVVDKVTANPGVLGADPIAVQANHIDICKPQNRNSKVYHSVCALVRQMLPQLTPPPGGAGGPCGAPSHSVGQAGQRDGGDGRSSASTMLSEYDYFTATADDDRRDLKAKLNDAERGYLVKHAERKKEQFAMALRKNIALPAAITRYTKLMADVESRYKRHVVRTIASAAPPAEVDEAIQKVVDHCTELHSTGEHPITANIVDGALYYLAGNCHLAFDNG